MAVINVAMIRFGSLYDKPLYLQLDNPHSTRFESHSSGNSDLDCTKLILFILCITLWSLAVGVFLFTHVWCLVLVFLLSYLAL